MSLSSCLRTALALLLAVAATGACAQLRLPGAAGGVLDRLPQIHTPSLPPAGPVVDTLRERVPLQDLRLRSVRELLRRHGDRLEADPAGEPMLRQQLLLLQPREETLAAALQRGYTVLRDETLAGLGERSVVLRPPRGMSTAQALQGLRDIDPGLDADFNHLYLHGGSTVPAAAGGAAPTPAAAPGLLRVGLIDSGVDLRHPALAGTAAATWGCGGSPQPASHGTAVASLLLGASPPGTHLYAADIYCGRDEGGSVEVLLQALAWMAQERVPVINISLVGPANRALERGVRALQARGHLVVAAVGNDGPAAPPLFPAAYAGVVGVTAVGAADTVLPEAVRGPQVTFAAPGAALMAAQTGRRRYAEVRGTSFAAPLVAGLLVAALPATDGAAAAAAVAALAARAADLGAPGRDPVYGHGLVGQGLRAPLAARAER